MSISQIIILVFILLPCSILGIILIIQGYKESIKAQERERVDRADIAESLRIIAYTLTEPKHIRIEKNDDNDYDIIL